MRAARSAAPGRPRRGRGARREGLCHVGAFEVEVDRELESILLKGWA